MVDWAISKHMKFNKCQILYLEWNYLVFIHRPGDEKVESSPMEGNLGVLVDDKLNMNQ